MFALSMRIIVRIRAWAFSYVTSGVFPSWPMSFRCCLTVFAIGIVSISMPSPSQRSAAFDFVREEVPKPGIVYA